MKATELNILMKETEDRMDASGSNRRFPKIPFVSYANTITAISNVRPENPSIIAHDGQKYNVTEYNVVKIFSIAIKPCVARVDVTNPLCGDVIKHDGFIEEDEVNHAWTIQTPEEFNNTSARITGLFRKRPAIVPVEAPKTVAIGPDLWRIATFKDEDGSVLVSNSTMTHFPIDLKFDLKILGVDDSEYSLTYDRCITKMVQSEFSFLDQSNLASVCNQLRAGVIRQLGKEYYDADIKFTILQSQDVQSASQEMDNLGSQIRGQCRNLRERLPIC